MPCADDLFYYVYGALHVPGYGIRYANNLRKELARLPLPDDTEQFWSLAEAGRQLADLHINFEEADEWPLDFEKGGWNSPGSVARESYFRVEKPMRHPRKDRTRITYNQFITVQNIPEEAYDYMVNGKPAIAWVMERQCIKTDKSSGIVNDANRYALETMGDPAYPLRLLARVIHISLETLKIVRNLPEPSWAKMSEE